MTFALIDEKFDSHAGALTNWFQLRNGYVAEVWADRPLSFWRLNETSGTSARGNSATTNAGTYTGTYTQGVTGPLTDGLPATLFDGATGYVALPASITSLSAFTIEAWAKTNSTATFQVIYAWDTNKGIGIRLETTTGAFSVRVNATRVIDSTGISRADNHYHHFVATWNGSTALLYVDGAQVGTSLALVQTADFSAATPAIGRRGGTNQDYYNGQIANVAIYDHVLTPTRIALHYNVGVGNAFTSAAVPVLTTPHYDIRAFNNTDKTVPFTMNDMNYWNAAYFNGMTMSQLNAGTVITSANETWTGGGVAVAGDSSIRYQAAAQAVVTVGSTTTFDSTIIDNILNDFAVVGTTYYIEGALKNLPAQAAAVHPDLTNSFIDFSSDSGYAAGKTDSFALSSSLTSLTAGGNVSFRFNLSSLINCDLTNLIHVRFRLQALGTSAGTYTFEVAAIRLFPSTRVFDTIDVGTRSGVLRRTIPQSGVEWTNDAPPIYLKGNPAKNFTHWMKFNTGHAPVGSNGSNLLSLIARYNENNGEFIQIRFSHNTAQTRLHIYENSATIYETAVSSNTLTDSTDYFMKVELNATKVRASIYTSAGVFPGALVYTTGWQTITSQYRGYVGLWFQPYHYDFTLDYMRSTGAQMAHLESGIFRTQTPIMGATLMPKSSADTDLMSGVDLISSGDGVLGDSTTVGNPIPSKRIARTGTSWYGGLETSTYLAIGNPQTLRIKGDVFVSSQVRGKYRVVLKDANGLIAYIRAIPNLTPNKWISFDLHVSGAFIPGDYKLLIQQAGFYGDTFYVDNLQMLQPTLLWEVSPDGGSNWYPFGNAVGRQYSGVNFPTKGSSLKLRASALDTTAWIAGYEIIPIYGYPGRT